MAPADNRRSFRFRAKAIVAFVACAFGLATGDPQHFGTQCPGRVIKVLGEDLVPVMDKILMPAFLPDDRPQLLQRPVCARVCGRVHVSQTLRTVLDDNKHVQHPERRSDSHEEVARENRLCVVLQEGGPARIATRLPGGRFGMYLPAVLGETQIPSLTNSSLAIRSSPHNGFSAPSGESGCAVLAESVAGPALPAPEDPPAQSVSGNDGRSRRMTSAVRQSKSLEDSARPTRVATAASSLQKRRRIDYRRGGMTILDRRGLKAASCGCYKPDWDFYDRILG
jgi:hypothetical protein